MSEQETQTAVLENEKEIVVRAKVSDEAFGILYEFYFPKIYGYIFKRVGNHEAAEDIVATTFMKIFCYLKNYRDKKVSFGAWVYKIATNNLIDYYRKKGRSRQVRLDEVDEVKDGRPGPAELAESGYNKEVVAKTLSRLNERYKKILHLKYFADLSYAEMAEVLGVTENNARVLVYRALKQFDRVYHQFVII